MTRSAKFGLLTGGLLLAAVALSFTFRAPLLEVLLRSALVYRDVPGADLTVESVTLSETTITGLGLGAADEVRAAKVIVAYTPSGLVAGRIESVVLDGVRLKLDLRGGKPPLGSLQNLAAGGEPEAETAAPALPPITLSDARVEVLTPIGPVTGRLEGVVRPDEDGTLKAALQFDLRGEAGRLRGELTGVRTPEGTTEASVTLADGALSLPGAELRGLRGGGAFSVTGAIPQTANLDLTLGEIAVPGASFEQAHLAVRLADANLEIDAEIATGDGQFTARATADLAEFPARPSGQIRLEAEIGAQAVLWPLLAIPAPSRGRAEVSLTAQGRLPPLANLTGGEVGPLSRLRPDDFTAQAKLRLREIDYPGLVQGLSGEARFDASPAPDSPDRLVGAMELALTAGRVTTTSADAREVSIAQAISLELKDGKTTIVSSNNGKISAKELRYSSILASTERLSARVAAAAATIQFDPQSNLKAVHDLTITPGAMEFALLREGATPLPLQARAKRLRARGEYSASKGYAGRIEVEDGTIAAPQFEAAAEHLNATLDLAEDGQHALAFQLGVLRHTADPPLVAPLSLRGKVRVAGDTATFSAAGTGPNGVGEVSVSGRHKLSSAEGQAKVALAPLRFSPGGAQPGTLFPAFADLRNVDGEARAAAALTWTQEGLDGTAALKIGDLSLESAAARIAGLSLDLTLSQLQPPGSAPGQSFRVRRIDPGVPLDDLSLEFRVVPGPSPAVEIENASLSLAGGRFSLADVLIDPALQQQHLPVQVEDLDLAEIFSLLGVEGLSGDGRLSGAIPLEVTDGVPRVASGRLTAQGPGLLRIRSDYATQALASAGESADLLLRALENFHYEELGLTIEQPTENLAVVGLSLLGNNPDVLEGYPFQFNINLETNPQKLLSTLQEAFRISNRAIGQMWIFGR